MREHVDGDFPFANDFNSIVQALNSRYIESGLKVTDGGTNDLTVNIASGAASINGTSISPSSQTVTLQSADSTDDRYDLVVIGQDGTAERVTGTASTSPNAPSIPADHALLAIIFVQAGVSGVTDGDIYDARGIFGSRYSDEEAQDAVGSILNDNLSYDDANNEINVTGSTDNYSKDGGYVSPSGSNVWEDGDTGTSDCTTFAEEEQKTLTYNFAPTETDGSVRLYVSKTISQIDQEGKITLYYQDGRSQQYDGTMNFGGWADFYGNKHGVVDKIDLVVGNLTTNQSGDFCFHEIEVHEPSVDAHSHTM